MVNYIKSTNGRFFANIHLFDVEAPTPDGDIEIRAYETKTKYHFMCLEQIPPIGNFVQKGLILSYDKSEVISVNKKLRFLVQNTEKFFF